MPRPDPAPTKGVGIGDRYARARLLLAKRAGYLPGNFVVMPKGGQASQQWRQVSKNLARDARSHGYGAQGMGPIQWLRDSASGGGLVGGNVRGTRRPQRGNISTPDEMMGPQYADPGAAAALPGIKFGNRAMAAMQPPTQPLFNFSQDPNFKQAILEALLMQRGMGA